MCERERGVDCSLESRKNKSLREVAKIGFLLVYDDGVQGLQFVQF